MENFIVMDNKIKMEKKFMVILKLKKTLNILFIKCMMDISILELNTFLKMPVVIRMNRILIMASGTRCNHWEPKVRVMCQLVRSIAESKCLYRLVLE